jgi:hypothetical protein
MPLAPTSLRCVPLSTPSDLTCQSLTHCELCEAAPLTEWYHSDEECWVAECESCFVPMVVWRCHDPAPDDATKARLLAILETVMGEQLSALSTTSTTTCVRSLITITPTLAVA